MRKQIQTSVLNIAYEEQGDARRQTVIFLHGFPDDARTWNAVTATLVKEGYHTLAPYLRGFGSTSFLSDNTMRSGQYAALASDVIELAGALNIDKFMLVGHDWGATTAYILSALFPERVTSTVTLSVGYNGAAQLHPSIKQIQAYWYQWHFNTQQGADTLGSDKHAYCRYLWQTWSPRWKFEDAEFETTAASFDTPDFIDIVLHNYRHRWKNAEGDPRYQQLEQRLSENPSINIPVIFLQGETDGASLAESSIGKEHFFKQHYERWLVPEVGHFIQRENPEAVINAILRLHLQPIG